MDEVRQIRSSAALLFATMATILGACSGAQDRGAGTTPSERDAAAGATVPEEALRITRVEVADGDDVLVTITDEGRVLGNGGTEVTGTLSPEGRLHDPEGTLIGTLHPDGRWVLGDGTVAATIDADGTVTADSFPAPLVIGDDGAVAQGTTPIEGLEVRGVTESNRPVAGLALFLAADGLREVFSALARLASGEVPPPGADEALRRGEVDCDRIDDPDYRGQVEAAGIDPESIDCDETE